MNNLNRVQEKPGYVDQFLDRRIAPGVGAAENACFEPVQCGAEWCGAVQCGTDKASASNEKNGLRWGGAVVNKCVDGASEVERPRVVSYSRERV